MAEEAASPPPARKRKRQEGANLILIAPGTLGALLFICVPLIVLLYQSVLIHNPGEVGAANDAGLTTAAYRVAFSRSYLPYLADTLRISLISAFTAVGIGGLIAYRIANTPSKALRKGLIALMLGLMFLSVLVRVYAISLTFGITGPVGSTLRTWGINVNSRSYTEMMVVLGFLHFLIPISTLILIGTFQRIPKSYYEAACSLGASRAKAHLDTTVRMALSGLYSTLIVTFSLAVSSFVIPLVLGQGKVQFLANLAYIRFGEMADYPGGAAFAIILLVVSFVIVGIFGTVVGRLVGKGR